MIVINLEHEPPSMDEIENERKRHEDAMRHSRARQERYRKYPRYDLAGLLIAGLSALFLGRLDNSQETIYFGFSAVCFALLLFGSQKMSALLLEFHDFPATMFMVYIGMAPLSFTLGLCASNLSPSVTEAMTLAIADGLSVSLDLIVFTLMLLPGVLVAYAQHLEELHLEEQHHEHLEAHSTSKSNELRPLDPRLDPQQIIDFDTWCDALPALNRYRAALQRHGRPPIVAEWSAARDLMSKADDIIRAEAICSQYVGENGDSNLRDGNDSPSQSEETRCRRRILL